jgi:hypothetical protein
MIVKPPFLKNIIIGHNNKGNELELKKRKRYILEAIPHGLIFFGGGKFSNTSLSSIN